MIEKKNLHREKSREAKYIPKPKPNGWFGPDSGDPEQMGLNRHWNRNSKRTKKK